MTATDPAERLGEVEAALVARWPENVIEPSLERMRALVDLLGDPQRAYPVIHVTGTNGKTSTARMIEALLRAFGLHTGLYTSPHLTSVRERILLDGDPIEPDRLVRAYDEVLPYAQLVDARSEADGGPALSFFELMTALAYAAFADAPVDVAIVEVGLGGTWDATNVADGTVAVVTPVDLDHTELLGETAEEIAGEKAGIVAPDSVLVMAQQRPEVAEVLLRRAADVGAEVTREGLEFGVLQRLVAVGGQQLTLRGLGGVYDDVLLPLFGPFQAHNAAVALAAVEVFLGGGARELDPDLVRAGFASVTSPGRVEVVRRGPTVLLDAAHNPHGARALAEALTDSFDFRHLVGVVAVLEGKDARGLLEALEPVLAEIVVTQNSSPRCLPADDLAADAVDVFGPDRVEVVLRLDDALEAGVRLAEESGEYGGAGVLVTGSIVTVGDARRLLVGEPAPRRGESAPRRGESAPGRAEASP